mgnify:CR=1 FL=1
MCGLFGMFDYQNQLTPRQKNKVIAALAKESETRGHDAAGIAYRIADHLHIYKRPLPAHKIRFCIPMEVYALMGHTRAATQGSQKKWQNNHPFYGTTKEGSFAFAHNGVIWNDKILRTQKQLPSTDIETDSYIAVQLLEQENTLDPASLAKMAEQIEGSFTFTVLNKNGFYFITDETESVWDSSVSAISVSAVLASSIIPHKKRSHINWLTLFVNSNCTPIK